MVAVQAPTSPRISDGVRLPTFLSFRTGSTWTRRMLSSRARVEARFAGLHDSHSAANSATVMPEDLGSIHAPRAFADLWLAS